MARNHSTHSAAWSITLSSTESDKYQSESGVTGSSSNVGVNGQTTERPYSAFFEFAALLLAISLASIVVGASNVRRTPPNSGQYVELAMRVAAGCDILVGLFGVTIALRALVSYMFECVIARVVLMVQFVFSVYAIALPNICLPLLRGSNIATNGTNLTLTELRIFIGLCAVAELSARIALLGAQLQLLGRMVEIADGSKTSIMLLETMRSNALFWCINLCVGGVFSFCAAAYVLLIHGVNNNDVVSSKQFGISTFPLYAVFNGLLVFVWGAIGVSLTIIQSNHIPKFVMGSIFVYIVALLNSAVFQHHDNFFSYTSAAANVGLVFAHGPFYMQKFIDLKNELEMVKKCTSENSVEHVVTPTNSDPI